ncbi:hypothetical protein LVJ94_43895 [Pendulispora rubella]|uniref:Desulfoferrodoxin ferrous iron-binding domain-containing protein n=1 Tax=Pendulispora rubella TaxID=2741070 RepID=A0ABZ2L5E4_9BACT
MARPTQPTLTRRAFFGGSVGLGLGSLAFARFLAACSGKPPSDLVGKEYNDGDEYIPGGSGAPAVDGEEFSAERRARWEALVQTLEALGPVYTVAAPGKWAGKERSHVPQVEVQGNVVTVLVEHMMSIPPLDAGGGGNIDAGGGFDADIDEDAGEFDAGEFDADSPFPFPRRDAGGRDGGGRDAGIDKDAGAFDAGGGGGIDAGAGTDAGEQGLHYVTTIYLKNEAGEVVGLREFRPLDPAPPRVNFRLPPGVKSVTAHEHCTLHGVWAADPVNVGS